MGKEVLTFRNIEIEKNKFYRNKIPVPRRDVDIEKVYEKTINTLLVTCIMIIKSRHYI